MVIWSRRVRARWIRVSTAFLKASSASTTLSGMPLLHGSCKDRARRQQAARERISCKSMTDAYLCLETVDKCRNDSLMRRAFRVRSIGLYAGRHVGLRVVLPVVRSSSGSGSEDKSSR
jgi:hypothetical protein